MWFVPYFYTKCEEFHEVCVQLMLDMGGGLWLLEDANSNTHCMCQER